MKYRRLNNKELKELEKEFVQFLATNHITAKDWLKLKENAPDKVAKLISIFSEIVFDKTLKKLEYLEFKTPYDIKTFHCQKDKITLMGLSVNENAGIDFTKNHRLETMRQIMKNPNTNFQIYTAEKPYKVNREKELYEMIQSGCLIAKNGALFETLQALKSPSDQELLKP